MAAFSEICSRLCLHTLPDIERPRSVKLERSVDLPLGPARVAMTNVVRSALPDYKRQKRLARRVLIDVVYCTRAARRRSRASMRRFICWIESGFMIFFLLLGGCEKQDVDRAGRNLRGCSGA